MLVRHCGDDHQPVAGKAAARDHRGKLCKYCTRPAVRDGVWLGYFRGFVRNRTGAADCVSDVSAVAAAAAVCAADKGRLEDRPCHSAAPVYMGQNRGARNAARIDAGIRAVLVLSIGFTAAIVATMLLAGKPLLGLFLSTEEAGAADALAVAHRYLMVLMAFLLALFVLQAYRSSLQGLGEMTVPTLSGFAEMLMRMGAALVLPVFIGKSGVFFAEGAAWVCAAALNLVWYYMRIGKIKREMMQ